MSACGPSESAAIGCGFEAHFLHARAEGAVFDDVDIVATENGAALAWSDRSGLHLRMLDREGRGASPARRIGVSCPGGVAIASDGEDVIVACARPADRDRARPGEIVVMRARGEHASVIDRIDSLGAESFGVDVATDADRIVVGWRDADVFTARAMMAEARTRADTSDDPEPDAPPAAREQVHPSPAQREGDWRTEDVDPIERNDARVGERRGEDIDGESDSEPDRDPRAIVLSSSGVLASAPSLMFRDGAVIAAWTESWFDAAGDPSGQLFVQREGEPPRPSLDVGDIDVRVRVTADARGPMIALRDRRPRGRDPRAFAGRLDDQLRLTLRDLRSPGRADAPDARPMLVPCGDHIVGITTRESSRGVTLVSMRRLDAELRTVEDEHQIYEYHARFVHAVGACVEGRVIVAVAERQSEVEPHPRLRTFGLRCGAGVAHERTPAIEGQVLRKRGGAR